MTKTERMKIISKNKRIDAEKLDQVLQILRKRRESGFRSPGYTLDIPFANKIHAKQER